MRVKSKINVCLYAVAIMLGVMFAFLSGCNKTPVTEPPSAGSDVNVIESQKEVTSTKIMTYDGPSIMDSSDKLSVKVEDNELFVYETRVNHNRIFLWQAVNTYAQVVLFDFEGTVKMTVTVNDDYYDIQDAVVRPLAHGITPVIDGNTITFTLKHTDNYVLEYAAKIDSVDRNGKAVVNEIPAYRNALHIFTNQLETNSPDPDNLAEDVFYIGPGIYNAGAIPVRSNMTVYIAGGAYVFGQFRAQGVENLTIRGRGIISGSVFSRTKDSEFTLPFEMRESKNLLIEDITVLDPAGWCLTLLKCEKVRVNNLKIITARPNGDGISIQSSKDVIVKGGFVRTWDDSLVVKAVDEASTSQITFDGVSVWTDLAQSMEVGFEAHGPKIEDITFSNITVFHNFHKAAISIHNADKAEISNITYKNITIEDGRMLGDNQTDGQQDYLIDFGIAYNVDWSSDASQRGPIKNVLIENIKIHYLAESIISHMEGENISASISGVTIKDVAITGVVASSLSDIRLVPGAFVNDVTYVGTGATVTGADLVLPYKNLVAEGKAPDIVKKTPPTQNGVEVPKFAIIDMPATYMGEPMSINGSQVRATRYASDKANTPFDDGTGPFAADGYDASNLVDGDRTATWKQSDWLGQENEFAALTFTFGELEGNEFTGAKVTPGVIRVYLNENSPYVFEFNIRVTVNTSATYDKFVNMIPTRTYSVTPARGNYFDIVLSPLPCYQIQLRMYRSEGIFSPKAMEIAEIEFLPLSLSTNAAIVASSPHEDVYQVGNITDGYNDTYYQSMQLEDTFVVIDLDEVKNFKVINLYLPGILTWEPRKQEITIEISDYASAYSSAAVTFDTLVERKEYLFDSKTGNVNMIELDSPSSARYVRITIHTNKNLVGGEYVQNYGGQLSEVYIY